MRSVKILIIGQPIVYRGAGFIKYLTRKNKEMDNFSSVIRHGFYVDIFSWNKRIAQPIGIMKVYLVDGLKILFTLIRKVMCYDVIIAPQYPSLVEFFSALVGSKVKNNILKLAGRDSFSKKLVINQKINQKVKRKKSLLSRPLIFL